MAFQTIQGSGGAPDSFLGTAGVDVIELQNQLDPTFLSARQSDDLVAFRSYTALVSGYSLYGGQGNDTLESDAATTLSSSFVSQDVGNDTIDLAIVSNSTIQGNDGNDTLNIDFVTSSITNGNAGNDTLNVGGSAGGSIFGGQGFDQITLVAGNYSSGTRVQANQDNDAIVIADGAVINGSTINGNEGNDNIIVGAITTFATSSIYGGSGNDTLNAGGSATAVVLVSNDGNDNLTGSTGADSLFNDSGNDTIAGGAGNDTYTVTSGNNSITTGTGSDSVSTSTGNDNVDGSAATAVNTLTITDAGGTNTLTGGAGTDTITGGVGRDTITGNAAADRLTGGAGADDFVFTSTVGTDTIVDFTVLQGDRLVFDISALGLSLDNFAAGALEIITAVQAQALALSEQGFNPDNNVIVGTNAQIQEFFDVVGDAGIQQIYPGGGGLAISVDAGIVAYFESDGVDPLLTVDSIGTIAAGQAAAIADANLFAIA